MIKKILNLIVNIFHRHTAVPSTQWGLLHAYCTKCGKVSFNPMWPKWRWEKR